MDLTKCDFSGYVTKPNIRCSDGVVITQDAFKDCNDVQVPIVWQHDYSSVSNVLGYMILKHKADGSIYGYGFLNDTEAGMDAKTMIKHGDLNALSIGARKIQKNGSYVTHGEIYEVSLVLKGANPGARIEYVINHTDEGDSINYEKGVIYTDITQDFNADTLVHSAEGEDELKMADKEKTIGDVFETLTDEQKQAVGILLSHAADIAEVEEDDEEDFNDFDLEDLEQSVDYEGDETLKHSIFNSEDVYSGEDLQEQYGALLQDAVTTHSSLSEVLYQNGLLGGELKHGLTNLDILFPQPTADNIQQYNPGALNVEKIMGMFGKSPMSRIKNIFANLTEEDARARGYIKGNQKLDSITSIFHRETTPGTVIRREKIDRDDMIDLQEGGFDIVNYVRKVQESKFKEEIVRAAILSDGRKAYDATGHKNPDKISEDHIRPIVKDDDLFVIRVESDSFATVVDDVVSAMPAYQGSGNPCLFINPFDLAKLKTLKDKNGRYLYAPSMDNNQVPGNANIAAYFMCKEVVEYRSMPIGQLLIGNLSDYQFGMAKGGEIATFDNFDIDFNQYKYLMEARLSGAIRVPKSFLVINVKEKGNTDLSSLEFSSAALNSKPTHTTDSDPAGAKGVGEKAVGYDAAVNGAALTAEEKAHYDGTTPKAKGKKAASE